MQRFPPKLLLDTGSDTVASWLLVMPRKSGALPMCSYLGIASIDEFGKFA